jgi:RNA polymerase sigma-70 factor (ECF subfamily)
LDRTTKDTQSFQREAIPHLDAVYRFASRLSGSPDAAEDLVQETFLRAFRGWRQYTPGTNCKSWLFTICRNVFLRGQERSQRHDEIVEENLAGEAGATGVEVVNPLWRATSEVDPEGAFFGSIVNDAILAAIDALPDDFRAVVVLCDVEGLSYNDTAALVDVPVGTVKSRLFRGRRLLQTMLYDYAVEEGYIARREERQ